MTTWYYAKSGQQLGPFSFEQLQQLASANLLQPRDFVWQEGNAQWVAADSVPGLCPVLAALPVAEAVLPNGTPAPPNFERPTEDAPKSSRGPWRGEVGNPGPERDAAGHRASLGLRAGQTVRGMLPRWLTDSVAWKLIEALADCIEALVRGVWYLGSKLHESWAQQTFITKFFLFALLVFLLSGGTMMLGIRDGKFGVHDVGPIQPIKVQGRIPTKLPTMVVHDQALEDRVAAALLALQNAGQALDNAQQRKTSAQELIALLLDLAGKCDTYLGVSAEMLGRLPPGGMRQVFEKDSTDLRALAQEARNEAQRLLRKTR